MISEIVDKVARALYQFEATTPLGGRAADHWRLLAREAITAMREPTMDMALRGCGWSYEDVVVGWQAMIDEALVEKACLPLPAKLADRVGGTAP